MNGKGEHQEEIETVTSEVTVIPNTSNDLLSMLIQKDAPLDFIKEFMDLRDRDAAKNALSAYVHAMAAFKKNPPEILKTVHVSYKNSKNQTVEWDHAELGEICEAINAGLSEHDLYAKWDLEQPEPSIVAVTCTVTHAEGHTESMTMKAPPDTSGGKDQLMAVQSTNTRLQRITLLAVTGIAAKGMDKESPTDEMTGAALEFITEDQVQVLTALCTDAELGQDDITRFLGVVEAEEVRTIPQGKYVDAKKLLDKAVARLKKKASK